MDRFYKGAVETIPSNAPLTRGNEGDLCMFIKSDHAGDKQTRKSRNGLVVHMNTSLINWYSKK